MKLNSELQQAYEDYEVAKYDLNKIRAKVQNECEHEWVRQHDFTGSYDYCPKCEKER